MATIPRLQEGQRMGQTSASPFQDSSAARMRGESISAFGRGVTNLSMAFSRLDGARRANAKSAATNEARREAQNMVDGIRRSGNGVEDVGIYDENVDGLSEEIYQRLSQKYGGKYEEDIRLAVQSTFVDYRDRAIGASFDKFNELLKEEIVSTNAEFSQSSYYMPDALPSNILDYEATMRESMEALGASPAQIDASIRDGGKSLTNAAVDGFMDTGRYDAAVEIVTGNEFGHFFTGEEQTLALDRIRNRRIQDRRIGWELEDRQRSQEERQRRIEMSERTAQLSSTIMEAEASGDTAAMAKAREEAVEEFSLMNIDDSQVRAILSLHQSGFKRIDAGSSLTVARIAYESNSIEDIRAARERADSLFRTGNMLPETHERWLRNLQQLEEKMASDPSFTSRRKLYRDRLGMFTLPADFLLNFLPGEAEERAIKEIHVRTDYERYIEMGYSPENAYVLAVDDHYKGPASLEPFAGWSGGNSGRPRDVEDLQELDKWARATLVEGSRQWNQYKNYVFDAQNAIRAEQVKQENLEFLREARRLRDTSGGQQAADDLVNYLDALVQDVDSGTLSPLLWDYSTGD